MAEVLFHGVTVHTVGDLPKLGSKAPGFTLTDGNLNSVHLDSFHGKTKVLNIMPSLDTPVCAETTRKFNQQATTVNGVVIFGISADLPFAQSRFCSVENIDNVLTLSLVRSKKFAEDYGVLITDGPLEGLCARAIVILNEHDTVIHTELVKEITDEPDYNSVLSAIKNSS